MAILEVKNLTKDFGGLRALSDVTFQVEKNEIVGIIGPNGAGKTTCFNLISGFIKPTDGKIIFKNEDVTQSLPDKLSIKGMVRTFQITSLFPKLTVFENVLIGTHKMSSKGIISHIVQGKGYQEKERYLVKKCLEILSFLKLGDWRDELAQNLSYGYQRKLEIAIALATEPDLLLLDEPAAGMNPSESAELMGLINEIRGKGITLLLVEHDMKLVMGICDRIAVLDHGIKIAEGKPQEIRKSREVIKVYLGSFFEKAKEEK